MSIVPKTRPALDPEACRQVAYRFLLGDQQCDAYAIIARCPVMLLAVRDPIPGRYNDPMALITGPTDPVLLYFGNTDPGRFGVNHTNGKFYARLQPGNWGMIRGHHNGVPHRFRQADAVQARDAGMPDCFHDAARAKGQFTVDRMETATKHQPETGMFNVNLHPGSNYGTSSAGCLTIAEPWYDEMRDAAYSAMDKSGQAWLPIVLITAEQFAAAVAG